MIQGTSSSKTTWQRMAMSGFLMMLLAVAGCATGPSANPRDPLEPLNRGVYHFNDAVDRVVIKPVATVYKDVLPQPVRTGVNNFFNNLQDAWSFVNNALQLKGEAAGNSLVRFGVNTVFGLAGLLDIATEMQIERYTEDFGQTLGYWGVGAGPYVVLPLLGPSTVRDTAALPVDAQGNLLSNVSDVPARNSATALSLLDRRARLLSATDMLDQVALDPYTFTRDAFLQRRRNQVYDGNPPDEALPDTQDQPAN
ncbi:phospholipid-binding lipoprotein MlaA [Rhodoferax lithotrophicus]|uniref:Phospholipid-binding lipoprotein MlaA n=2 Tax=Rhodoferax lithotrophicus TaxID=2798804 RepID=A0ABM7MQP3_9BURK|nr:phospholipid-binding lipoprotein MlaA [Rhodoferax sp. MIZ03]